MNRRHFLAMLAGTAAATPSVLGCAHPSPARPVARWRTVQELLDRYVAEGRVAGAATALSHGGSPAAYAKAGRIALNSPVPFDEDSLCRVFSMTKPVTGIAAMMLIEAGELSLDQPVSDVIPEFRSLRVAVDVSRHLDSVPAARIMTMRHLLTHTSGLGYWTQPPGAGVLPSAYRMRGITPGNYGSGLDRPGHGPQARGLVDMVQRVAELPLLCEPGTAWNYSIGLDVMGLVIQRVAGTPLDSFLRARLFEPLGMTSTGFQVAQRDAARLTTNHDVTPEGLKAVETGPTNVWLHPPPLLSGGAGLVSSARDFARFGAMLLGDGTLGRVRIIDVQTARRARSNLLPVGVRHPAAGGFGAGGMVVLRDSELRFAQPGTFGFRGAAGTLWFIDSARGRNMVFMSQHMAPDTTSIWADLAAAFENDLRGTFNGAGVR